MFVIFSSYKYIPGVVAVAIYALIQRIFSFYNVYVIKKHAVIDLVVLFACIYVILESEYTSLYYSVDTIAGHTINIENQDNTYHKPHRYICSTYNHRILHREAYKDQYICLIILSYL